MRSFNRIRVLNQEVSRVINGHNLTNIIVADIATDHGYLAEQLSKNEKIAKIYATDISQKCLDKTNKLKEEFKLDKIETKLGDGLDAIDAADVIVVAGVGGYEIIKMLSNQNITINGENKSNIFILQPSKNPVELRKFLIQKNIKIENDFICKSGGKFYPIISADLKKNNDTETNIFNIYFGRENSTENADFVDYLNYKIEELSFLEKLSESEIENSDDLKTKNEILKQAKTLLKNR